MMDLLGYGRGLNLAWALAKQDVKNRYASSYAGVAWAIGVPLLYAIINVLVFSILMTGRMGVRYDDIPFAVFYFLPFSLWVFFADVSNRSTSVLREYSYLINKIAFPFWVLPLVPLLSALINQLIVGIIFIALLFYHDISVADTAWLYFVLWSVCFLLALGVSYGVSALSIYIPDFGQIVPVVVNILFWLTPILYPPALVEQYGPAWLQNLILNFNPFHYIVELVRQSVFGSSGVSVMSLAMLLCLAFLVLFLGVVLFKKLKSGFADVI